MSLRMLKSKQKVNKVQNNVFECSPLIKIVVVKIFRIFTYFGKVSSCPVYHHAPISPTRSILNGNKNFYLFPMLKLDEKTGFGKKKQLLVAILKFSDETGRRFLELLDVTIQYHRT